MFRIETTRGLGDLERRALRDESGETVCELVPERGAIVTRLRIGGEELLFLDEATLVDRTKNVRGGIPVLFPIAGQLLDDAYALDGVRHRLKQHGFARTSAWEVVASEAGEEGARVSCRLQSSEATLAVYPRRFELRLDFELDARGLTIRTTVTNVDARPLPYHLGFHPYFRVPDASKASANVRTDASTAFDNREGVTLPFSGFDFTAEEVDVHLLDHRELGTRLDRPPLPPVQLTWDAPFTTLVVWTLRGRDFVCVEPWTAPAGALETGTGLRHLPTGQGETMRFRIAREGRRHRL